MSNAPTRRHSRPAVVLPCLIGATTLALTACTSPGQSQTGTTPQEVVDKALAGLSNWESGPSSIATDVPLKGRPDPGELVAYAQCTDIPLCANYGDGLQIALSELDWNLQRVNWTAAQPATLPAALTNALQLDPIAVASGSEDYNFWRQVIPQFESAGVPLLPFGADRSVPVTDTLLPTATGDIFYETTANVMADWVIGDSGGTANTLLVNHTDFNGPRLTQEVMENRFAECGGCTLDTLEVSATQFQNLPNLVAGAVQKNPNLQYLLINPPGFTTQILSALRAAGLLEGLEVLNTDLSSGDIPQIEAGELVALGRPYGLVSYQAADSILRGLQGLEIPPANSDVPLVLVTKDNIEDFAFNGKWLEPNFDYASAYRALWKLGG